MQFKEFSFHNSGTYKKFKANLQNLGVVFLKGRNLDTGGSNGAGKSMPWDILRAILFSVSDRGLKKDDLVRKRNHNAVVKFDIGKKHHEVLHWRKYKGHPNGYQILINGKDRTPSGGIPACEKTIKKIHGLTEEEFRGFVHMSQGSLHTLLEGSGAERLHYISSLFGLNIYDEIREALKSDFDNVNSQIGNLQSIYELKKETERNLKKLKPVSVEERFQKLDKKFKKVDSQLSSLRSKVSVLEEVGGIFDELKTIKHTDVSGLQTKLSQTKGKIQNLESLLRKKKERSVIVSSIKRQRGDLKHLKSEIKTVHDLSKDIEKSKRELAIVENDIRGWSSIKGAHCPTCKQKVKKDLVKQALEDLKAKRKRIIKNEKKFQKDQEQFDEQSAIKKKIIWLKENLNQTKIPPKIKKSKQSLDRKLRKVEGIRDELLESLTEGRRYESLISKLKQSGFKRKEARRLRIKLKQKKTGAKELSRKRDDLLSDVATIKSVLVQISKLKEDLRKYTKRIRKLDELQTQAKVLGVLLKAYSSKGLKLGKIKELGKNLTDRLNVYARPLFSEKSVKFTVPTDGDRLDFLIERGNARHDIKFLSGGERKRLTIAFILATNSMTPPNKSSNLIILDEVDAGLDDIGKESFRTYLLPKLKRDFESVIVISHSDAIKSSDYDQIWTAIKRNGVSRISMKKL